MNNNQRVRTNQLRDLSITSAKYGYKSIIEDKYGDLSIPTGALKLNSIVTDRLIDNVVTKEKLHWNTGLHYASGYDYLTNPTLKFDIAKFSVLSQKDGTELISVDSLGNLTVLNNIYFGGSVNQVNVTDLNVSDRLIRLNVDGTDASAVGGGILLEGTNHSTLGSIAWNSDKWTFGESISVLGSIYLNDTNTQLIEGSGNALRIQTGTGYIDIGSQNTSHLHLNTDRSNFYFNTQLRVNTGQIGSYDEDLYLQRATVTKLTLGTSGATFVDAVTSPRFISTQATGTSPFTVASTTVVSNLNADYLDGYHLSNVGFYNSVRDFADGTLITTNINYAVSSGDSFYVEIKGNSYSSSPHFNVQIQGYIWADTITSHSVTISSGGTFPQIKAMNIGGYLCFWFPRITYWNGFSVFAQSTSLSNMTSQNRVTAIANSTDPSGTSTKVKVFDSVHTIWSSFNDGVSSGLDADLWQGWSRASYLNQAVLTTSSPTFNQVNASTVAVTNIVTNKIVKFNGAILDDSIISEGGTTITVGGDIVATKISNGNATLQIGAVGYTSYVFGGLDVGQYLNTYSNMRLVNKAQSGWITWATRNTSGTEALYDLSNIGSLSISPSGVSGINIAVDRSDSGSSGRFFLSNSTSGVAIMNASGSMSFRYGAVYGSTSGSIGFYMASDGSVVFNNFINVVSSIKLNGTTIIDSSRNLTNIGTISSGAITSTSITPTNLTTGYIPYKSASTLVNSPIYTDGTKVGIGTTAPNSKFTIAGTSAPYNGQWSTSITTGAGIGTDEMLQFGVHDGDYSWIQAIKPGTGYRNILLNPNGGNVGIGTTSPTLLFQVSTRGGMDSDGVFYWGSDLTGNNRGRLTWDTNKAIIDTPVQLDLRIANNTKMTIASSGNVLIGTTTDSGYKLEVNGIIYSRQTYGIYPFGEIISVNEFDGILYIGDVNDEGFATHIKGIYGTGIDLAVNENIYYNSNGAHYFNTDMVIDGVSRLSSTNYSSSILGSGFSIGRTDTGSHLEIDNITVRNTLRTHIFQKDVVKVSNGYLLISDGCVVSSADATTITFRDDKSAIFSTFPVSMWIKDANSDTGSISSVKFTITSLHSTGGTEETAYHKYNISYTEGTSALIQAGMTAARISGGTILLDASSTYAPFIDISDGASVRARLGNLAGLSKTVNGVAVTGYGLWSDNAYLKGGIVATFGKVGLLNIDSTGFNASVNANYFNMGVSGTGPVLNLSNSLFELNLGSSQVTDLYGLSIFETGNYEAYFKVGINQSTLEHEALIAGWYFDTYKVFKNNIELNAYEEYIKIGTVLNNFDTNNAYTGFVANSTGNVLIKAGTVANTNYLKFYGEVMTIDSTAFTLKGSNTLYIDTTKIALGASASTLSLIVGTGVYTNSSGHFKAGSTTQYAKWDGTNFSFAGNSASLTTAGLFTATNANITGVINASSGNFTGYVTGGTSRFGASVQTGKNGLWLDANNFLYQGGEIRIGGSAGINYAGTGKVTIGSDVDVAGNLVIGVIPNLPSDEFLIGYWDLDSANSKVLDNSGNSRTGIHMNNLTESSPTLDSTAPSGTGFSLNQASNQRIRIDDGTSESSIFNFQGQSFSISIWAKTSGYNSVGSVYNNIFGRGDVSTNGAYGLRITTTNTAQFSITGVSGSISGTTPAVNDGKWHHYVVIVDQQVIQANSRIHFYFDGVLISTTTPTSTIPSYITTMFLGCETNAVRAWNGSIDEARVYNTAISHENARALYLYPKGTAGTIISGNQIKTGSIQSTNYAYTSGDFSTAGTLIDLDSGFIRSKQFAIDSSGNATFAGSLSAASGSFAGSLTAVTGTLGALTVHGTLTLGTGTIASTNFNVTSAGVVTMTGATINGSSTITGTLSVSGTTTLAGWSLATNKIYNGKSALTTGAGVYIGTDGIALGSATPEFKVTSAGVLTATSGSLGGLTFNTNTLSAGSNTANYATDTRIKINAEATPYIQLGGAVAVSGLLSSWQADQDEYGIFIGKSGTEWYLNAYNYGGSSFLLWDTTNGLRMSGEFYGGTFTNDITVISGKSITGGIIQTASSGNIIQLNATDNAIKFIDNQTVPNVISMKNYTDSTIHFIQVTGGLGFLVGEYTGTHVGLRNDGVLNISNGTQYSNLGVDASSNLTTSSGIKATGAIHAVGGFKSSDGSAGISGTFYVRDDNNLDWSMTVKNGLITSMVEI